jgi:hypothetical protein
MESDEALARRLQQEEEEEAARYERDAAYARSLLLSQQLGLTVKPQKKNKNTNAHIQSQASTITSPCRPPTRRIAPRGAGDDEERSPRRKMKKKRRRWQVQVLLE